MRISLKFPADASNHEWPAYLLPHLSLSQPLPRNKTVFSATPLGRRQQQAASIADLFILHLEFGAGSVNFDLLASTCVVLCLPTAFPTSYGIFLSTKQYRPVKDLPVTPLSITTLLAILFPFGSWSVEFVMAETTGGSCILQRSAE